MVGSFSSRQVSLGKDRTIGVAQVVNMALKDKYLAGVWLSALPLDLLWKQDLDLLSSEVGESVLHDRPKAYQGPSWSWTSINGPVSFPSGQFNLQRKAELRLHILDSTICLVTNLDPYGAVSSGLLRVKGRLRKAR